MLLTKKQTKKQRNKETKKSLEIAENNTPSPTGGGVITIKKMVMVRYHSKAIARVHLDHLMNAQESRAVEETA